MNAKVFVFILGIAAVAGVLFFVHQTTQVDVINADLVAATQQLEAIQVGVKNYQTQLDNKKASLELLAQLGELRKEQAALNEAVRRLKKTEDDIDTAFDQAVARAREKLVGQTLPEVLLASGVVLRNAKIQRCDAEGMTIVHDMGVSKVAGTDLSVELQNRLRYKTVNTTSGTSSLRSPSTYASDQVRLLGQAAAANPSSAPAKKTGHGSSSKASAWQGVTKQSLGRAFIPGQGWLEIGPNGPIPGTGSK